jgi:hypothetical protein
MGAASPGDEPDNFLDYRCDPGAGSGNIIAILDYETPSAWASFWIGLDGADFSSYDTLTFFARGDPDRGIPPVLKLELKRQDDSRVGIYNLAGLTDQWQQYPVSFADLCTPPGALPLCGWDGMYELVFTFESDQSKKGTIYLDDIYVERRGEGAPAPGSECVTPTPQPSQPPQPPSASLIAADFDSCAGTNNSMGAAYNPPDDNLMQTYVQEPGRGCVARLEYHITNWSAFWMKLQGVDLSPYSRLTFDVRADQPHIPGAMKIELKRAGNGEVSIKYVSGITADWQNMSVNLSEFGPTGYTAELSSLTGMEELVFTFEASRSGTQGVVYLDNVTFRP